MVSTFEALSKKFQLLVDYCDVFVDDPLMEWVWVSRKQLGSGVTHQLLNNNQTFSVTQ
jgi:phosphatidylinositol kinase/protein kinase (PI-3  family)